MLERIYPIFPAESWPGPVTAPVIARVENRLGIVIPAALRSFLTKHDGTPGHCGVDHGWIRVWSVAEWSNPVRAEDPTRRLPGTAFFADWGISSDEYYFDGVPDHATYGHIYVSDGRHIADSFTQFMAYMLNGSNAMLW